MTNGIESLPTTALHLLSASPRTCRYSPLVEHLRLVQFNAIRRCVGSRHDASRHRRSMLRPATARIVLVQIVRQSVPATAHAYHHVRPQDLQKGQRQRSH